VGEPLIGPVHWSNAKEVELDWKDFSFLQKSLWLNEEIKLLMRATFR
jgi:hypothetical protein